MDTDPDEGAFRPHSENTEVPGEGNSPTDRARMLSRDVSYASVIKHVMDAYMDGRIKIGFMTDLLEAWQFANDQAIIGRNELDVLKKELQTTHYQLTAGHISASEASELLELIRTKMAILHQAEEDHLQSISNDIMKHLVSRSESSFVGMIEPSMANAYTITSGPYRGYSVSLVNWTNDEYGRMTRATVQIFTDMVKVAGKPWRVSVRADQLVAGFHDLDDHAPGDIVEITGGAFKGMPARVMGVEENEVTVELFEAAVPVALTLGADQLLPTHRVDTADDEGDDEGDDETCGFGDDWELFG